MTHSRFLVIMAGVALAGITMSACGSSAPHSTTTTTTSPVQTGAFVPTSPAIARDVATVPLSVFNAVGVSSPQSQVTALYRVTGAPPLNWTLNGHAKPTIYYFGAEYCPFCAAERWPLIIAMSRFGTFAHLGDMQSSSTDAYKNTQTFTLWKATYTSPFVNFFSTESYTDVADGDSYTKLQTPTATEIATISTFDTPSVIPGVPQGGSIPFVSFNNQFFIVGASYDPQVLAGQSRATIAGDLTSTSTTSTQAIIATANLITAAVCHIDAEQPSTVCQSSGVLAADKAMQVTS